MGWAELSTAILNTMMVMAGVLMLGLPVACLLALAIVRTNMIGARPVWLGLLSQLMVPLYAHVGAWNAGFGTQGWWPLSQVAVAGNSLAALAAVSFLHALASIPAAVLILALGLHWSRRSHEEMAVLDGGERNLLLRVLLPELRGWIAAAALWMMVPILTEMVVTNLYQVPTLPELVYLDISLGTANVRTYLVAMLLCALPLLILAWWLRRLLPSLSQLSPQIAAHTPQLIPLRQWRWPLSLLVWAITLAMVLVPLLNLLIKAGWEARLDSLGVMQHRWMLARLMATVSETTLQFTSEFRWSALLAIASATTALLSAAILRCVSWRRRQWRWCFDLCCVALIVCPGPLVAAILMQIFLNTATLDWFYDHTLAAPILAQQSRLLPLAWLLSGGIVATIGRPIWEMAQVDQLSWWQRWRIVVWRPTRGLWLAVWLLLAAISVGELSTHLLLLPAGVTTVAQRLFELLHFGMRYQDSGLCLALVLLSWLVAIALWKTRAGRA